MQVVEHEDDAPVRLSEGLGERPGKVVRGGARTQTAHRLRRRWACGRPHGGCHRRPEGPGVVVPRAEGDPRHRAVRRVRRHPRPHEEGLPPAGRPGHQGDGGARRDSQPLVQPRSFEHVRGHGDGERDWIVRFGVHRPCRAFRSTGGRVDLIERGDELRRCDLRVQDADHDPSRHVTPRMEPGPTDRECLAPPEMALLRPTAAQPAYSASGPVVIRFVQMVVSRPYAVSGHRSEDR